MISRWGKAMLIALGAGRTPTRVLFGENVFKIKRIGIRQSLSTLKLIGQIGFSDIKYILMYNVKYMRLPQL